jgi:hypothetical protein
MGVPESDVWQDSVQSIRLFNQLVLGGSKFFRGLYFTMKSLWAIHFIFSLTSTYSSQLASLIRFGFQIVVVFQGG